MTEGPSLTTLLMNALTKSEALQKHVEESNNLLRQVKLENESLTQRMQLLQQSMPENTGVEKINRIDQLMGESGTLRGVSDDPQTCGLRRIPGAKQPKAERPNLERGDHDLRDEKEASASVNPDRVDLPQSTCRQDDCHRLIAISNQLEAALKKVEQLTRENESLRSRLERQQQVPDISAQLDSLFKQNIEKQAENDQLRVKIKHLQNKQRTWRPQNTDPSSCGPYIEPSENKSERQAVEDADLVPNTARDLGTLRTVSEPQVGRKRPRIRSPPETPLREMSGNARLQLTSSSAVKPRRSLDSASGTRKVDELAEDGENHSEHDSRIIGRRSSTTTKAAATGRLENLLFTPRPDNLLLGQMKTPDPLSASRQPQLGSNSHVSASIAMDQAPLREKPRSRLNLKDFKVNPRYSGGELFAVVEVARNKERRECLAGCTKAECCGANFKALATTLPQLLDGMSDDELLVEFLGPGQIEMMEGLTPLAKTNLVAEARTKKLADAFGKMHRSAFDRAPSPPGYWNTEMPGTQEEQDNRAKSSLWEKEEIEKRYREAMKKDGRWLFVDE
ncbi:hypothetical protein PV10_03869 [Exophiala mesophila]|uniref:DNA endonuclease activator Ctp1 C-terminal domain-containing protein n=1 Tax=Exophiala mesophila TaxID=212818 RepID=A0A0D1WTQ5_EXOME|nr:uncharacterized protein PV10_03869 [Exophiala mesophila]KIV92595.1 hypothetical protein PV10_03869 [Exophiala mesophila]